MNGARVRILGLVAEKHTSLTIGFLPKTVTNLLPLFVSKQLLSCSQR